MADTMQIEKYEAMVKLELPGDEREKILSRITGLAKSFDMLSGVDTEGVEPLVTVLGVQNILREDICEKNITRGELISNSPEHTEGYFQAPKTLKQ